MNDAATDDSLESGNSTKDVDGTSSKDNDSSKQIKSSGHFPIIRRRQHSMIANVVPFHERNRSEFLTIIFGGSALAFNSGFINGCTLLSIHPHPVSHVTGTTSHAGIDLASGKYDVFGVEITLVICFIFGAAITGYWMPASAFQLGRQYGPLFLIGSGLLLIACLTSYFAEDSVWYFYFAAMASGLQNGMTTKYSGSIIRTTHLTGASTDIGLALGRMVIGDYRDSWKLQVLVPLFISFFTGGFLSKFAVDRMGRLSLLVNVLIFFNIGLVYSIFVSYTLEISLFDAFLGSYRTAGEKLRDARDNLLVHDKLKGVIRAANSLKSKAHSKVKSYRPFGRNFGRSAKPPSPTNGPQNREERDRDVPDDFEDVESLVSNPIHN